MVGSDIGPFRTSRPVNKPGTRQPKQSQPAPSQAATSRQPEPSQPFREEMKKLDFEPREASRSHGSKQGKSSKWLILAIVIGATIILIGAIGLFAWEKLYGSQAALLSDGSKYQAVTTTDGQVYFGQLSLLDDEYIKLSNAYYLRAQPEASDAQDAAAEQDEVKLVKLNNKIYSPKNTIVIPKAQILSYENLDPSGKVVQFLEDNNSP